MAYMNVYDYKIYNKVPAKDIRYTVSTSDTAGEIYVEIDDDIVYLIQSLNVKGYHTRFCCSGHYGEETPNCEEEICGGYIFFENPHHFNNVPDGIIQETGHILRFTFKTKPNTMERFYELNKIIYDLSLWASELDTL